MKTKLTTMTKLLISVRNANEAKIVLAAGADLIDIKEPDRGSLGAAEPETINQIIRAVGSRVPLSAALGELNETYADCWNRSAFSALEPGLNYAKMGLAGCASWADWPQRWAQALAEFAPGIIPVAVVYADFGDAGSPRPDEVLFHASDLGCGAVLLDTFDKSGGDLLERWSMEKIAQFVADSNKRGLLAVLGGSLTMETISKLSNAKLMPYAPDYFAVRGAACVGGRTSEILGKKVLQLSRYVHSRQKTADLQAP